MGQEMPLNWMNPRTPAAQFVVLWAHPSPQPEWHLGCFSCFSTAHGCDQQSDTHNVLCVLGGDQLRWPAGLLHGSPSYCWFYSLANKLTYLPTYTDHATSAAIGHIYAPRSHLSAALGIEDAVDPRSLYVGHVVGSDVQLGDDDVTSVWGPTRQLLQRRLQAVKLLRRHVYVYIIDVKKR